jgi:Transglutaminase-like superfamily
MKALLFIYFFLCYCTVVKAQENYSYADHKALQIPQSKTYSTDSIANYVKENFTTGKEKIRAVYTWVTNNIAYSKDSIFHFNRWGIDPEINMSAILRRRKGVCENYAALFAGILVKSGVQAVVVTGYTNIPANRYWNGHGWVAVQTDGEWFLCDPTWDAGTNNYTYFLVVPAEFIQTHIPFDPLWQLLEQPVSHKDFQHGFSRSKKEGTVFNYKDSVATYLQSDTLQQMEGTSRRMLQAGFGNEDVKTWYNYNQMKVHIVLQEENMQWYNEAVDNLNNAKKLYNQFVEYRNNHFTPPQAETSINTLFTSANKLLEDAYKKNEAVGRKSENYQYDTEGLKENLDSLKEKVQLQEAFWKQYLMGDEAAEKRIL